VSAYVGSLKNLKDLKVERSSGSARRARGGDKHQPPDLLIRGQGGCPHTEVVYRSKNRLNDEWGMKNAIALQG